MYSRHLCKVHTKLSYSERRLNRISRVQSAPTHSEHFLQEFLSLTDIIVFTFVATETRVTRHFVLFIFILQYFSILMIAPVCLFRRSLMMLFALYLLRLMRDYNGCILSVQFLPRHLSADSGEWRPVIWDSSNFSHRDHSRVMNFCNRLYKKLYNICKYNKKNLRICISVVGSLKLPIMIIINHVLRCLNLTCTLVPEPCPSPAPSLRAPSPGASKTVNDYKLQNYTSERSQQRYFFI